MSVRFMMLLCCVVLTGDTASRTSLPGGDDDSLVDDSTSSRWTTQQYSVGHKKTVPSDYAVHTVFAHVRLYQLYITLIVVRLCTRLHQNLINVSKFYHMSKASQ